MTKSMKRKKVVFISFKGVSCISGEKARLGIGKNCLNESCESAALILPVEPPKQIGQTSIDNYRLHIGSHLGQRVGYMDCKAPSQFYF